MKQSPLVLQPPLFVLYLRACENFNDDISGWDVSQAMSLVEQRCLLELMGADGFCSWASMSDSANTQNR